MFSLSIYLQRVVKNFAANTLGQAMNGVYQLISIPLFLHYWSKPMYGEWLVLFSVPAVLWSLEGGLSGVASGRMTVASAAGNWELANSIFQNVLLAQSVLALLLLSAALVVISTVDLRQHFGFTHLSRPETSAILVLLLWYMLTGFYLSLFRSAYRVAAREARGVMSNNTWRLLDFIITVVVLTTHGSPLVLARAIVGGALFWLTLIFFDTRRISPQVEFGIRRASWHQSKRILIDGLPLLAGQAATAFFLQGYPLVINRVLGASAVVTFVTVRTVSRTILLLIQVVSFSSAPEVSRSYGRKDWDTYLRLLKIMLAFALWGGMGTLVVLSTTGPWLLTHWTSGKVTIGHAPMFLFAVSIALQGLWGVGGIVLVCSNMHHLFNYLYFAITLGALLLARLTLPLFGFLAVPGTMALQDAILVGVVLMLWRSKLSHISLRDLRPVITFGFYRDKLAGLVSRMRARGN